jgi:FKBP-type peptidyl-prolyl cis-trans isomerase SlyD
MLTVQDNHVITLNYQLKNQEQQLIDSSDRDGPIVYLHGAKDILPGIEKAVLGLEVGGKAQVSIPPEEAYGDFDKTKIQEVPRSAFAGMDKVEVGMHVQEETPQGPVVVTVTEVTDEVVTVDANHPLAGQTLHFDLEVAGVREASEEEISHGHVHGPDGHHH